MSVSKSIVSKLLRLYNGDTVPSSQMRGGWVDEMLQDGVLLTVTHGSRRSYWVNDKVAFENYVEGKFGIRDLYQTAEMLEKKEAPSRAEQVEVMGDSKVVVKRTMKGFLVNSYEPIEAMLNGKKIIIAPPDGSFSFIYDFEQFLLDIDTLIVGIENSENFRHVEGQRWLFDKMFPDKQILFVSRYPQNNNKDLQKWLMSIDNKYVHFGDLDLSGMQIYLTEFRRYIGDRASFLIPFDYEERIQNGSFDRYNVQEKAKVVVAEDPRLKPLVDCINKYHRGYDQEGYIV